MVRKEERRTAGAGDLRWLRRNGDCDQNIRYQQNLRAAGMAVVVMCGPTNQLTDLEPLAPAVLAALTTIQPGEVVEER